jgi:hypothetical protein
MQAGILKPPYSPPGYFYHCSPVCSMVHAAGINRKQLPNDLTLFVKISNCVKYYQRYSLTHTTILLSVQGNAFKK